MDFDYKLLGNLIEDKYKTNKNFSIALKRMGITKSEDAIKKWRQGNSVPKVNELSIISKALDVKISTLFQEEAPINEKSISIPIIEALAGCGSAGLLDQLQISDDKMSIDKRLLPRDIITDKLSMIRIVGDSMMPYLDENDWAIIQMRNGYEVTHVNGVYLITHGENVHIKRCAFQADGSCLLISDNPLYPVETAYAGDWDIVGKVVARLKFGSPMLIKE